MTEVIKHNVEKIMSVVRSYVHVIGFGNDLGTEESPDLSRCSGSSTNMDGKKYSKAYIFFNSYGSIFPLIRELIDAGIDIINPVQISVKRMDLHGQRLWRVQEYHQVRYV